MIDEEALVANLITDGRKWKAEAEIELAPNFMKTFLEGRLAQCVEILTWIGDHTDGQTSREAISAAEELIP